MLRAWLLQAQLGEQHGKNAVRVRARVRLALKSRRVKRARATRASAGACVRRATAAPVEAWRQIRMMRAHTQHERGDRHAIPPCEWQVETVSGRIGAARAHRTERSPRLDMHQRWRAPLRQHTP